MTKTVLLAPHHDDETLFASCLTLEHQPDLIICTRAEVQAARGLPIQQEDRLAETMAAWRHLSPEDRPVIQWPYSDIEEKTDWLALADAIAKLPDKYDRVIAPAPEPERGHRHHDTVGRTALDVFGRDRTILYLTYARGSGRSTWGEEVPFKQPDWILAKLRALACYATQVREASTRPWFVDPLTEYVAS